jgi:hypothetical protein
MVAVMEHVPAEMYRTMSPLIEHPAVLPVGSTWYVTAPAVVPPLTLNVAVLAGLGAYVVNVVKSVRALWFCALT